MFSIGRKDTEGWMKGVLVYFRRPSPVFLGPVGCQRRIEHGLIDGTLARLLYPCLYTCPFSSCTDSFIQHSARHCSLDQFRHTDRLMESNTDIHTNSPNTASLASPNLVLSKASFLYKPIHSYYAHTAGCVFSLGLVPVLAVK